MPSLSRRSSSTGAIFLNHTELSPSTLAFDWSAGIHAHVPMRRIRTCMVGLSSTTPECDDSTKGAGAVLSAMAGAIH